MLKKYGLYVAMKEYLFFNGTKHYINSDSDSLLLPTAVRQKCLCSTNSFDALIDFYKDNISTSWGSLQIFLGTCKMSVKCQKQLVMHCPVNGRCVLFLQFTIKKNPPCEIQPCSFNFSQDCYICCPILKSSVIKTKNPNGFMILTTNQKT